MELNARPLNLIRLKNTPASDAGVFFNLETFFAITCAASPFIRMCHGQGRKTTQTLLYTPRISPLTRLSIVMTAGRTIIGRIKRSIPTGPILENAGLKTDDSGAIAPNSEKTTPYVTPSILSAVFF